MKHVILTIWTHQHFFFASVFHCLQLTTDNISVEYDKDVTSNTTNVQLKCNYDLDGDSLYSIKWYKDRREFYRFHPDEKPSATTFPVNGVNVYVTFDLKSSWSKKAKNFFTSTEREIEFIRGLLEVHRWVKFRILQMWGVRWWTIVSIRCSRSRSSHLIEVKLFVFFGILVQINFLFSSFKTIRNKSNVRRALAQSSYKLRVFTPFQ